VIWWSVKADDASDRCCSVGSLLVSILHPDNEMMMPPATCREGSETPRKLKMYEPMYSDAVTRQKE
jgi:hypothetical protein